MRQNQIHGIGEHFVAKRSHVLGALRAIRIGPLLRQARHEFIDIEGKVIVFVAEVLVERRPTNHSAVAQHGNRHVLKPMLFEQLSKGLEQGPIGFLDAKVHTYRPPQGKDSAH